MVGLKVPGSVNELANENEEKTREFFFFGDASCNAKTGYVHTYVAYHRKRRPLTMTTTVFVIRYHRWEGKTEFGGGELLG